MGNKINFGLKNVSIAFRDEAATTQPAWKTPVAIPGAVDFKPKAAGNDLKVYADDGLFYTASMNNGYTADLQIEVVPDDVLAEMFGWSVDNNGVVVEDADGVQKEFALMGQVSGDQKNRKFVYYSCKASRPEIEYKTKEDKVTPATAKLSLTILPILAGGKNIVKGTIEENGTNQTAYDAFFNSVTLPDFTKKQSEGK